MRMKSKDACFFFVLALLLVVTPCAAKTEVVMWHNSWTHESVLRYAEECEKAFEKLHPDVDVVIETIDGGSYTEKVILQAATGLGPDVIELWPGSYFEPLVQEGLLLDLLPLFEREGLSIDRFVTPLLAPFMRDGKLVGVPSSGYPVVTYFSPQMWGEAGLADPIALGDNWTWETVKSSSQKLTQKEGEETVRWGVQVKWHEIGRFMTWPHQAGGNVVDDPVNPTKATFDSAPVLRAWEWILELQAAGVMSPTTDYKELVTGKCATLLHAGPYILTFPEFRDEGNTLREPIGLAPMPKGPVHNGTVSFADGWMLLQKARDNQAVWEWLKFISTNTENSRRFGAMTGRMPALVDAISIYPETLPTNLINGQVLVETAMDPNTIVGSINHPRSGEIGKAFRDEAYRIMNGDVSPVVGMKVVNEQVQQMLSN